MYNTRSWFAITILCIGFTSLPTGAAADAVSGESKAPEKRRQCPAPAPLNEHLINPVGLKSYLKNNSLKIKSVDDLICCLPESLRSNYVVVHNSLSAQSSDPHGPRILMYTPLRVPVPKAELEKCLKRHKDSDTLTRTVSCPEFEETKRPIDIVLSFNGGGEHLTNNNNVEILFNNKKQGEIEFFDVVFDEKGKFHFSGKNPEACINCHGAHGQLGIGGPRPIFDPPGEWLRVVEGAPACTPGEETLFQAIRKASSKALATHPRYRCLSPTVFGKQPIGEGAIGRVPIGIFDPVIDDLDLQLANLNDRRSAKIITRTEGYENYKYAIVGSLLCFDSLSGADKDFSAWLPERIRAKHDSRRPFLKAVAESDDLIQTLRSELEKDLLVRDRIEQGHLAAAKKLRAGESPGFTIHTGPTACIDKGEIDSRIVESFRNDLSQDPNLNRFLLDGRLRAMRNFRGMNPYFRYLFEGRGVDVQDLDMAASHGDYRRGATQPFAWHLIQQESAGSPLREIWPVIAKTFPFTVPPGESSMTRPSFGGGPREEKEVCARLKALSLAAFGEQGGADKGAGRSKTRSQ